MAWTNLMIQTSADSAEKITDYLIELGAISASIQDKNLNQNNEEIIFGEPHDGPQQYWKENTISALFEENIEVDKIKKELENFLNHKIEAIISKIEDQDWVKTSQDQFNPICIRDKLWIIPTWHSQELKNGINLILDPGLAFGTGSHPTTHLCIEWLIDNVKKNNQILDYGCGSGILAIAAKKIGCKSALGVDIDPQALIASKDNAKLNNVNIEFIESSEPIEIKADLIVANILSSALSVLAPVLASYCRPGGIIALSGILETQEKKIKVIYQEWFDIIGVTKREGWVCISAVRRNN
ncbi:MAG: 50S ribosomal protein L11 methyltransferase [Methylophilaceae bacterium]|jgi:ribosomal protein L11 methyltransferase|nr:50S ribosomal protein L11 methyltransferase [Methylophilaceae bacterium]